MQKIKTIKYLFLTLSVIGSYKAQSQPTAKSNATVETIQLSTPISALGRLGGISIDKLGTIYVADFRDKVWKVAPTGETSLLASGLYGSSGNTIDNRGNLIQSNFYANSVVRIDRSGNLSLISSENLNGPVGVAVDENNNIYVCNCSGNTITKIDSNGLSAIFSQSDLYNCPNGITFGPTNELYVTNYHNDIIVKIDQNGEASKFTTVSGGQGVAHITYLNQNFYVSKIKANTIFRVTPDGQSFLLAGSLTNQGAKDGDGLDATFAQPNGITQDPWGDLYVNTLNGPWVINAMGSPGTIEIRKIDIKTITEIFDDVLNRDGIEAAVEAYWEYRKDPSHQHEDTGVETGTYAWQLMIKRKIPEAIRVFTLLAETYPERWRPYYYLGQVYTMIGQTEKAIEFYKTSLEKNPNNPLVETKLKELK